MEIDAYKQTAKDLEFEYTDRMGRVWELSADIEYSNPGSSEDDSFKLESLDELKGRWKDGPYIEVAPDDGMVKQLKHELDGHRLIYEAEQLAISEGRDEYVREHDE
jgi:hypothetical protein